MTDSIYPTTSDPDTSNLHNYAVEEVHPDTQLQLYAAYLLEEMMRKGLIEEKRCLAPNERTWMRKTFLPYMEDRMLKGYVVFSDAVIEAAIMWWVNALEINMNLKHAQNLVREMKGEG